MNFGEDENMDSLLDGPLEEEGGAEQQVSGGKVKVGGLELDLQAMMSADGMAPTKNVEGKSKQKAAPAQQETEDDNGSEDDPDQQNSDEEGDEQEEETDESAEGKSAPQQAQKSGKQAAGVPWAAPLQRMLRGKYGAEVTLPINGTADEVFEAIEEIYSPDLHPEVARIQDYVSKGGKVEDYLNQRAQTDRLLALEDDKALMFELYKNQYGKSAQRPRGLDDEKIKDVLSKKDASGALVIEALQAREALEKQKGQAEQENASYARKGAIDPQDPQEVQRMQTAIEKNTREVIKSGGGKLYGLDLSKAGSEADVINLMKYMFTPDQKGISPYQRKMTGNGNMVRAALLVHFADQGLIDAALLEKANSGKRSILKRIPTQPRPASGGKSGAPKFDIERAKRPETFSGSSKG